MKTTRKSWLAGLSATGAVLGVLAALMLTYRPGTDPGKDPSPETRLRDTVSVTRPEPDWWESRRLIYFDIPARVLFHLPGASRQDAQAVARAVWNEFDRTGGIFNPSDPDSEVSRLNSADKTKPVRVSKQMHEVLKISQLLWQASNGAFDPTTAPLKKLWQNAVKTQKIPSARQIQRVLGRTGFDKVTILENPRAVMCKSGNMVFDFGGIAKGFAVDQSRAVLRDAGIHAGLVQLGGEVSAFGSRPGRPWRIGIQHPADLDAIWDTLCASSEIRVSTSGNYRQPLIIQGHRFYHIFSPKTGRPVSAKVAGVTTADLTAGASNALLDGAATAITVLGAKPAAKLSQKLNIEALVLTKTQDKKIKPHLTPGLERPMNACEK